MSTSTATQATKSFHQLEAGDVVAAYGTTLRVTSAKHDEPTYGAGMEAVTRTLVEWIDLQPELRRTYRGPWSSGLRSDIVELYAVIGNAADQATPEESRWAADTTVTH